MRPFRKIGLRKNKAIVHRTNIPCVWLLALLCLLLTTISYGQQADSSQIKLSGRQRYNLDDSIRTSFKKKPKLVFRWDSHGSFITNSPARMTALGLGLRFGNHIKLGLSVDFLNSNIYRAKTVVNDSTGLTDTVNAKLNYGTISFYSNFVLGRVKRWEFTLPVSLGLGSTSYSYSLGNKQREMAKGGIISTQAMIMAEYKVFRWLGLGAGLGLRLVPISNSLMKENFNSMLWDANLSIYFGEIYRSIKGAVQKKKTERANK